MWRRGGEGGVEIQREREAGVAKPLYLNWNAEDSEYRLRIEFEL